MGILNITPDSFFDGGKYQAVDSALHRASQMISDGADVIDIGAESTRPGATPISSDEELDRLIPILSALKSEFSIPISVDTYKSDVAEIALSAGAQIINDVSGLSDSNMAATIAKHHAQAVIMHKKGSPQTMQDSPSYHDVINEIKSFFSDRISIAKSAGISKVWIDPGIGFGKTASDNLTILGQLNRFADLGAPLLIGPSQKRFIGDITGEPPENRLPGTIASCVMALTVGAEIFRVHHVKEIKQALSIAHAIQEYQ